MNWGFVLHRRMQEIVVVRVPEKKVENTKYCILYGYEMIIVKFEPSAVTFITTWILLPSMAFNVELV